MAGDVPTLLDWLRARSDEALAALLRVRPDLALPPPSDLAVLATRVGLRISALRASEDLDSATLNVLTALVVADADTEPVPLPELQRLLGPDAPPQQVGAALDTLRTRALAWGDDAAIHLLPAGREVAGGHPGGLGAPSPALADHAGLGDLLAGVSPEEHAILTKLSAGPPVGRTRDGAPTAAAVERLVQLGLLARIDQQTVELPRQVALALRGEHPMGPLRWRPPQLSTSGPGAETVDATAAGAVLLVLRQLEALLGAWTAEPPAVLRSGGLGVRELRKLARQLDAEPERAALLAELAVAAGWVGESDGPAPAWEPTTLADSWLGALPEHQWLALARAWLELPRLPGLVGARDEAGRPLAALSDGLRRPTVVAERRRVLDALVALPPGHGVRSVDELAAVLAWQRPRRGGRLRDEVIRWTLAEGTALGLVALDALGSAGRALLNDPDAAATLEALRSTLPEPVDHVVLQADLTAVAPGRLRPELAAEFGLLADVESSGSATVYRITEASLRRAMDAGRTASELHEVLATHSVTPVPQGLSYLVDDVARQHGRLRGGQAGSFLRAEDEVLLAEVLAHPIAAALGVRRIAPSVLVSPLELAELLDGLRAAGFAPVAEDAGGGVLDLRPPARRIPARPRPPVRRWAPTELDGSRLSELVARMRAGDRAAAAPRGAAVRLDANRNGTSATLQLLQGAAQQQRSVWIGYIDASGMATERIVEPVSVGGGILEGYDPAQGGLRRFLLHRITSAAVVQD
jgi:hypothetical protein